MTTVYGLIDPRTKRIMYVGQTTKPPRDRLRSHIGLARWRRKQLAKGRVVRKRPWGFHEWLWELDDIGIRPGIVEFLTGIDDSEGHRWEALMIRFCDRFGHPIFNRHRNEAPPSWVSKGRTAQLDEHLFEEYDCRFSAVRDRIALAEFNEIYAAQAEWRADIARRKLARQRAFPAT